MRNASIAFRNFFFVLSYQQRLRGSMAFFYPSNAGPFQRTSPLFVDGLIYWSRLPVTGDTLRHKSYMMYITPRGLMPRIDLEQQYPHNTAIAMSKSFFLGGDISLCNEVINVKISILIICICIMCTNESASSRQLELIHSDLRKVYRLYR